MQLKKLILVVLLGVLAVFAFGQDKMSGGKMDGDKMASMSQGKMVGKAKTVYVCEKCDMASSKAGKCPMCHTKMAKMKATVDYQCPECKATSAKAGTCPHCHKKMEKMATMYTCKDCHTSSAKMGTCPKCGKEMEKHEMKMKN